VTHQRLIAQPTLKVLATLLCLGMFTTRVDVARAQSRDPGGDVLIVVARPAAAVRIGPSTRFRRVGAVAYGTHVTLIERNDAGWARVRTSRGLSGWVIAQFLRTVRPAPPQAVTVQVAPLPAATAPADAAAPTATIAPELAIRVGGQAAAIFARGQALGNRANVFSVIGDSLSTVQPFLRNFASSDGYALGPHAQLQAAIDFFSAPPRDGVPNSYAHRSLAATIAFNAAAALDPSWTVWTDKQGLCQPNETPLACEFRVTRPSVALILLGPEDMQIYDSATFRTHMDRIVDIAIASGVIPVLSTFPTNPADPKFRQAPEFNAVIRQIVAARDLPMVELREWAMTLPAQGVKPDGFHLSDEGPAYAFDRNPALMSGCAMRNLFTLQMLDALRRDVLTH
jgi:Bacterial SH3 domain